MVHSGKEVVMRDEGGKCVGRRNQFGQLGRTCEAGALLEAKTRGRTGSGGNRTCRGRVRPLCSEGSWVLRPLCVWLT